MGAGLLFLFKSPFSMRATLFLLAGAVLLLGSCTSQNGEDLLASGATVPAPGPSCDTTRVTYAATVAPLLLRPRVDSSSAGAAA